MIDLILNPAAGSGFSAEVFRQCTEYLDAHQIPYVSHTTEAPGDATRLAKEASERGSDTVIAFGGDGTVREVAAGLRGTKTALGIVPCGTGNDFIKTAAVPKTWQEALEFILQNPARPVNSGLVNDSFFMNECGTGFDVMVLDYAEIAKKHVRGIWPYLYGVIRAIRNFKPIRMRMEIGDDIVLDGMYMVSAIGNGRFIGGGIPITPRADLGDGLFDIMVVDAVPRWKIPFYLPSLLKGTLRQKKIAHEYRADRCTLSSQSMRLNIDGEIVPMDSASFLCEKDALLLHW